MTGSRLTGAQPTVGGTLLSLGHARITPPRSPPLLGSAPKQHLPPGGHFKGEAARLSLHYTHCRPQAVRVTPAQTSPVSGTLSALTQAPEAWPEQLGLEHTPP